MQMSRRKRDPALVKKYVTAAPDWVKTPCGHPRFKAPVPLLRDMIPGSQVLAFPARLPTPPPTDMWQKTREGKKTSSFSEHTDPDHSSELLKQVITRKWTDTVYSMKREDWAPQQEKQR